MTDAQDLSAELAIVDQTEGATQALASREQADIQSALIIAKKFPRNEDEAFEKLLKASKRPSFASCARYAFPRGGQTVAGPSINLAREAARMWGNIRWGINVLPSDSDHFHIEAWALDVETNSRSSAQDRFPKKIYRKSTGWMATDDERDLRELMNRRGALALRNCLLQLLPRDLIEDAVTACMATNRQAAQGELRKDPTQVKRALIAAFGEFGVTVGMLEQSLGHSMEEIDAEEVAGLREIYRSMKDGNSKRADHFRMPGDAAPDVPEGTEAAKINAQIQEEAAAGSESEAEREAEQPLTEEQMQANDAKVDGQLFEGSEEAAEDPA